MLIDRKFCIVSLSLCSSLLLAAPAFCQNQNYQQLEQMLDNVAPSTLTPVNSANNSGSFTGSAQFNNGSNGQFQQSPSGKPFMQAGASGFRPPNSPLKRAMNFLGGAGTNTAAAAAAQPVPPAQSGGGGLFKTLFGDAPAGSGGSTGAGSANMYRAQTQAGVAHNAYVRSCYGDHYSRSSAADEAYYAAQQARYEADCAYSKISSGDPYASQYATSARAYANAADADYYRARSNADSNWSP